MKLRRSISIFEIISSHASASTFSTTGQEFDLTEEMGLAKYVHCARAHEGPPEPATGSFCSKRILSLKLQGHEGLFLTETRGASWLFVWSGQDLMKIVNAHGRLAAHANENPPSSPFVKGGGQRIAGNSPLC
jgi:hypothetical protein